LVLAAAAAGCGPGSGGSSSSFAPDELGERFTAALAAELAAAMDGAVPGMGRCFAEAYVGELGAEVLVGAGMAPDSITMDRVGEVVDALPAAEQIRVSMETTHCALMYTAAFMEALGVSPESTACFVGDYEAWLDREMADSVGGGRPPLWTTDETAFDLAVFQLMAQCVTPEELDLIVETDEA
jgi:hypothetical protein